MANLEYEDIIIMKTDFDKILGKVNYFHSNHGEALNREI